MPSFACGRLDVLFRPIFPPSSSSVSWLALVVQAVLRLAVELYPTCSMPIDEVLRPQSIVWDLYLVLLSDLSVEGSLGNVSAGGGSFGSF